MLPLVSIVIPVYNASLFVAETIESTLKQSYQNIELILVDDGSEDNSYEIAKQYESPNVTVVKQANKGASAARNYGIRLAKGDYVQFLDADDFLHPQKIEYQLNTLKAYSDLHLIGGTWQRFIKNLDQLYGEVAPSTRQEVQCFNNVDWLIKRPMMIPNTWLVSKKLINLVGPWDEQISLNDDGEYFYRVIAASAGVVIDRKAATYYRSFNNSSLSSRNGRKAMLSWIQSIQSYKKILCQVAGDKGNNSVDEFFYLLSYWCLNEFPDLVQVCKSEMYQPEKTFVLEDKLVYRLSKFVGLSKAKYFRTSLSTIKQHALIKYLIQKIKFAIGKPAY
ncbi:MAG: glycosyltransferase family 2 protein [Sphingobacteriaceae bacterium]|nr:MAG: glycosyltransferase family 2 protein [Sphingobacteriaceae bacterium]